MNTQQQHTDAEIDATLAKQKMLKKMYPNIGVAISFCSPEELNNPVSLRRMIMIRTNNNCYCGRNSNCSDTFVEVKRKGTAITHRDVFEALDKIGIKWDGECGHIFFEGIWSIAKSDVQFEMMLGS